MTNQPEQADDRYKFEHIIDSGTFGTTWQGWHTRLERPLAIKVVDVGQLDESGLKRVLRECKIAGELKHNHIVEVFDAYQRGTDLCIVMELMKGGNLNSYLTHYQPSLMQGLQWGLDLTDALATVHDKGIIHRDIKPANILLTEDNQVKIADFGVAHVPGSILTGAIQPGTPAYYAPEQDKQQTIDTAVDVYALSAVLFEIFSGTRFFQLKSLQQIAPQDEWQEELLIRLQQAHLDAPETVLRQLAEILIDGLAIDRLARTTLPNIQNALRVVSDVLAGGATFDQLPVARPKPIITNEPPKHSISLYEERAPKKPPADVAATTTALPLVEIISSNITLSAIEKQLLQAAFIGYQRIEVESELRYPLDEVRLLVVLPFYQDFHRARVIIKFASPELINREWQAYALNVKDILPQDIAQIQAEPLMSSDGTLALLGYPFFGDTTRGQVQNLATFYQNYDTEEVSKFIAQNFLETMYQHWWQARQGVSFLLRREYGSLLPVHLVVERTDETQVSPLVIKANSTTIQEINDVVRGQSVQIQDFHVQSVHVEKDQIVLWGPPAESSNMEPLRFQLVGLLPQEQEYQPGQVVPNFPGIITNTRHQILLDAVQPVFPDTDLAQSSFASGKLKLRNPLHEYDKLLDESLRGMVSPIHGQATLENIMIAPKWQRVWLINFASIRKGHNLFDLIFLETQIITRLITFDLQGTEKGLEKNVVAMAQALHSIAPSALAPDVALQKPYELLRAIRHYAGKCLRKRPEWDEYYQGLTITLLGTMPTAQTNLAARLTFIWAATIRNLIGKPVTPPSPPPNPLVEFVTKQRQPIIISSLIGIIIVLVAFWGFSYFFSPGNETPSPPETIPASTSPLPSPVTATPGPAPIVQEPTPTPTPTPTSTLTPTPIGPITGVLREDLNIYSRPPTIFNNDVVGTVAKNSTVQITGRDEDGHWLQILDSSVLGGYGWIEAKYVDPAGEVVKVATYPPPPTATSTPSSTPTATETPLPTPTNTFTSTPIFSPTPSPLPGTPTASINALREFVGELQIYQDFVKSLAGRTPTSTAFSPNGQEIASTEGDKLYIFNRQGHLETPVVQDGIIRPVEGITWSPNGQHIAFVADYLQNCNPCRVVGIVNRASGAVNYLEPPEGHFIDLPRWTQDGRLLILISGGDPATKLTHIHDIRAGTQPASGSYQLSSNQEGQQWSPWKPGVTWQVDQENPDGYYHQ